MFNAEDLSLLQAVKVVEIFAANQKILVMYPKEDNLSFWYVKGKGVYARVQNMCLSS